MRHYAFGAEFNYDAQIEETSVRFIDNPKLANIVLDELYDDMAGLGSAENTGPLSLVAMTPRENVYENTIWDSWVDDYLELNILKYFGITLDEFMSRGRFEATELLRMARRKITRDAKRPNMGLDSLDELEKELT